MNASVLSEHRVLQPETNSTYTHVYIRTPLSVEHYYSAVYLQVWVGGYILTHGARRVTTHYVIILYLQLASFFGVEYTEQPRQMGQIIYVHCTHCGLRVRLHRYRYERRAYFVRNDVQNIVSS